MMKQNVPGQNASEHVVANPYGNLPNTFISTESLLACSGKEGMIAHGYVEFVGYV